MSVEHTHTHQRRHARNEHAKNSDSDGRAWITETGRGETCRTCQTQIDVRHVLGDDGNYVTLCAGCRSMFVDGGSR